MGTRCLTVFKDEKDVEIVVMYRQFDGYLDGHGIELKQFLEGKKLVNGINGKDNQNEIFNGMGCLAASVISHFKDGVGGFYLYPAGTRDVGEEYVYEIYQQGVDIYLKVEKYDGPIDNFDPNHEDNELEEESPFDTDKLSPS